MSENSLPPALEEIIPADVRTWKLIPSEKTPATIYVCLAKIRSDAGQALRVWFDRGMELSDDLRSKFEEHVAYSHGLGDKLYEAGPSADFTEILYMYRTETMEEARQLLEGDPFYQEGIFGCEWFFEWHIHAPIYKSSIPAFPEQVLPVDVELRTPQNLIASIGFLDQKALLGWQGGDSVRPIFDVMHLRNMHGDGGLSNMGLAWGCGPIGDGSQVLHVLAVPTVEIAREVTDMEALARWGIFSDFRYFEWCIHYPVGKACPRHKAALSRVIDGFEAS